MSAILRVRAVFNASQAGVATDAEVSQAIDAAVSEFEELRSAWATRTVGWGDEPTTATISACFEAEATLAAILGGA